MKTLYYSKHLKKIVLPENWNELTGKQLISMAALLSEGIKDPVLACDKALYILSDKSLFSFWRLPQLVRAIAHVHVAWIFEEQSLTKQLLPVYDALYGPDSEFNNLQLAEFHHAEMACYRLMHEKDEEALDELIAIL